MDPLLGYFGVLFGVAIASGLAWHAVVKAWVRASVWAGLTTGVLAVALLEQPAVYLTERALVSLVMFSLLGMIVALGVGIPFSRRRKPHPGVFASPDNPNPSLPLRGRDAMIMLALGAVFTYLFFFAAK